MFFTFAKADFTSQNFIMENPTTMIGGVQSSSPSFRSFSITGQLENGQSSSNYFIQNSGFMYFPEATSPVVSTTPGDAQVILNWTPAAGILANITNYDVGMSTSSGGTYTYTSVGNALSYTKTGLKNGMQYFFKVRSYATGLLLSESAEVSGTSVTPIQMTSSSTTDSINPTKIISESLHSLEGTTATINISPNTLADEDTYKVSLYSFPETEVTATLPVPSGKAAASTMYNFSVYSESNLTAVSNFTEPVTISVSYTATDVSNLVESSLALYSWDGSQWTALSNQVLDTVNNTISGATMHFSNFAILGTPVVPTSPSSPPSGGGGGGGGGPGNNNIVSSTGVVISGRAYPLSKVTVLKDGQLAISTIAGPDSNFSVTLGNLSAGQYTFSVYGEDKSGLRSSPFTFQVSVTSGVTTNVSGVFITPTISVDKSEVKKGENIAIFGQSAPSSQIVISVHSQPEFFKNVTSDSSGVYLENLDTSVLDLGQHLTKSKTSKDGQISPFSDEVSFVVGTKDVLANNTKKISKSDLNGDGKTNLIDFSILAFWYKKKNPPANVDLNKDGLVNLVDFSIMAFNWTG